MPRYGLGHSVGVYQFAPHVTLNASQMQAEARMEEGGGGGEWQFQLLPLPLFRNRIRALICEKCHFDPTSWYDSYK